VGGRKGQIGRREHFRAKEEDEILTTLGREDVFLVHPQNGFNNIILN